MAVSSNGLGWLPDLPDHRDYTIKTEILEKEMNQMGMGKLNDNIPSNVDLKNGVLLLKVKTL